MASSPDVRLCRLESRCPSRRERLSLYDQSPGLPFAPEKHRRIFDALRDVAAGLDLAGVDRATAAYAMAFSASRLCLGETSSPPRAEPPRRPLAPDGRLDRDALAGLIAESATYEPGHPLWPWAPPTGWPKGPDLGPRHPQFWMTPDDEP